LGIFLIPQPYHQRFLTIVHDSISSKLNFFLINPTPNLISTDLSFTITARLANKIIHITSTPKTEIAAQFEYRNPK
jgi:uncharacterized membrane protein